MAGTTGKGGNIQITSTNGNVTIQDTATEVESRILARGGTTSGEGSQNVSITAASNLSMNNTLINVSARGLEGNGGSVSLTAGNQGSGDLIFAGTILANAGTTGVGGTINLTSVSGNITPSSPGVPVILRANGGSSGGDGGTITLAANAGGINIGDPSLSAASGAIDAEALGSGTGGVITITSNNDQVISVASMSVNSSSGQAGTIALTSNNGNITTTANLLASSTDAAGSGNGGAIFVLNPNGSANIAGAIHADAAGAGYGGEIYIDGNNDTEQGAQSAKGFFGGVYIDWNTPTHPVGQITVNHTIDVAGTSSGGIIMLSALGTILVKGSLIAGAGPNGSAGQIIIEADESGAGSSPFVIGSATNNGITGSIENTGNSSSGIVAGGRYQGVPSTGVTMIVGAYNNSGVVIQDFSTATGGGITIPNAGVIHSALNNALVTGIGNNIVLNASGTLTIGGHLSANYQGQCCGSNIYLQAPKIVLQQGASVSVDALTETGTLIPAFSGTISISTGNIVAQGNNILSAKGQTIPLPGPAPIAVLGQGGLNLPQATLIDTIDPARLFQSLGQIVSQILSAPPQPGALAFSGTGTLTFRTSGNVAVTASSIVVNSPIIDLKGTLTMIANGPGGISKDSTVKSYVLAHDATLTSLQGNIGTSTDSRLVVGGDNIALIASNGSVFANIQILSDSSGNIFNKPVLQSSKANGDFDLLSNVVLKIDGNVSSSNGSVTINTKPGNLTLDNNFQISAKETITLQSTNKIFLGNNTKLLANNVSLFAGGKTDDTGTISIGNLHFLGLVISPGTGEIKVPKVPFLGVFHLSGLNNDLTANNGGVITINGSSKGDIDLGGNVQIIAIPIAFSPDAAAATLAGRDLQSTRLACGLLSYSASFKSELISKNALVVHQGSCMIHTEKQCTFQLPGLMVNATQESVILMEVLGQNITVRNLGPKICKFQFPNHRHLDLMSGEEISLSHNRQSMTLDNISRRRTNSSVTEGWYCRISEVSIYSLLASNPLLVAVRHSSDKENKRIAAIVLKTAAALSVVTANHGAYRQSSLAEP